MSVAGVGIDLVDIARIERALERRPRLAARLFTDSELAYASARRRPARHLAARFAAKEAVVKAMGLGPETEIREIEVLGGAPPGIRLGGAVRRAADDAGLRVSVSLSHERETATAIAVAESVGPAAGEPRGGRGQ
jgi:holo-[acyl-carrier protein] synthase